MGMLGVLLSHALAAGLAGPLVQRLGWRAFYPLALVLELQVDKDELVQRLLARKRADDNLETITQRLEVYRNETAPVLKHYADKGLLEPIDGQGTPDEVFDRIQAIVAKYH